MIIDFYQWLISSGDNLHLRNFRAGYVWGTIVVLVLLVVVKLIHYYMFIRQKKVQEVRIAGEGGSFFVSASAIADMVRFVGEKFEYIEIQKVFLREGKNGVAMAINVVYDTHGERFPVLATKLKEAIQENLDGQLGIDSIETIDIHGKKITNRKNSQF
ncbi:MAG: hypothetical protein JW808_04795 [Victivallales bacterium]|nr:hypothetical protein [Victivallales bacterium]